MAWERRKGRLYFYKKEVDDLGRVQSRYMGRGQKAIEASRIAGTAVPDEVLDALSAPLAQPDTEAENLSKPHIASRGRESETESDKWLRWVRARQEQQASVAGKFRWSKPGPRG
jgi:hypothetical protein